MTGPDNAVVAVDVGTSAVRAALVSPGDGIIASHRVARTDGVGGGTFDAEALFQHVLTALAALPRTRTPVALAITAHIGTVPVDRALRPVAASGGWADHRGTELLTGVGAQVLDLVLTAAGRPTVTGGGLALALHLQALGCEDLAVLLSPKDFLVARLTGVVGTDAVDAAYTLASDVRAREWNEAGLAALAVSPSLFPDQSPPDHVVGGVLGAAAEATGIPVGTPVVSGGPDGSVGIGLLLGSSDAGIADVAGTTDVLARLVTTPATAPHGAVVNPAMAPGLWTVGGATGLSGGAVAQWRSLVGQVSDDELTALPAGAHGLSVIPTMTGSRFPRWRSNERGALLGQTPDHGPAHLLRAAQEGASFTVREGLDLLDPVPGRDRLPVCTAGGSTRASHVVQLRADVTGRVIRVCSDPDVTLLGAAALAMIGAGVVHGLDDARTALQLTFDDTEPDPQRTDLYDDLYRTWLCARDSVTPQTAKAGLV